MSDAASLWRKALAVWTPVDGVQAVGLCVSSEPFVSDLAARVGRLALWDWRQSALSASPLETRGWTGDPEALPAGTADLALLDLETLHGRASFEQAVRGAAAVLRPGGALLVRGGNHNGVGGAVRRLRDWFGGVEVLAYGGGHRVVAALRPGRPLLPPPPERPWEDAELGGVTLRARRTPGVFAEGLVDPGTRILAEAAAEQAAGRRVCDLGCGTGLIGLSLLARGAAACTFCDEDLRAMAALEENLAANAARTAGAVATHAIDARAGVPGGPYDLLVCNPPFHQGIAVSHGLSEALVTAGWEAVGAGGRMLVVGMRFLPLDRWLPDGDEVAGDRSYRVLAARRPAGGGHRRWRRGAEPASRGRADGQRHERGRPLGAPRSARRRADGGGR